MSNASKKLKRSLESSASVGDAISTNPPDIVSALQHISDDMKLKIPKVKDDNGFNSSHVEQIENSLKSLQKKYSVAEQNLQDMRKKLKLAESVLGEALFQAEKKLKVIKQSKKGRVNSEEVIQFSGRLAASYSVNAPANWMPGDQRRPYPTDLEMQSGFLGSLCSETNPASLSSNLNDKDPPATPVALLSSSASSVLLSPGASSNASLQSGQFANLLTSPTNTNFANLNDVLSDKQLSDQVDNAGSYQTTCKTFDNRKSDQNNCVVSKNTNVENPSSESSSSSSSGD